MEDKTSGIIPAASGWFIVNFVSDDHGKPLEETWLQPVVAWRIVDDVWAEPISIEIYNPAYVLLAPDGHVYDPECDMWDSISEYYDHVIEKFEAKHAG